MKFKVIMTKCLFGDIIVEANDKETAVNEARDIVSSNKYKWYTEEKIVAHEAHVMPLYCHKCNTRLSPESIYCNICGAKL